MKYLPCIAGGLLGALFLMAASMFFFNLGPAQPPPPEGSYVALFMGGFVPSGYLAFVKSLQIVGGILVAIPKTRNFGLLVLGPIIVNIIAYHAFIMQGAGLTSPMLIAICLLALYLLWDARKKFAGLAN
ncbi:hypothetical protein OKA04_03785 [Luteolibacter flavescens]|uniref:DoxX family protein n=1 Tax=Luteolibacter flavescens TaxID=1859460 RepID=A0ABT3FKX2_9BACT|nr:hypothetical protein [Luteolibacter flavescens]MCW1883834.1 hypothetical protein [Luteolibacter flavescens]